MSKKKSKEETSSLVESNDVVSVPAQPTTKEVKVEVKKVEKVNPHKVGANTRAFRQ